MTTRLECTRNSKTLPFTELRKTARMSIEPENLEAQSSHEDTDVNAVKVHPRRKSGSKRDATVVTLTFETLSRFFGQSIEEASKQLGLSATALRRACRKLGVNKWPYERKQGLEEACRSSVNQLLEDSDPDLDDKEQQDFDFCASAGQSNSEDDQEYIQRAVLFHISSRTSCPSEASKDGGNDASYMMDVLLEQSQGFEELVDSLVLSCPERQRHPGSDKPIRLVQLETGWASEVMEDADRNLKLAPVHGFSIEDRQWHSPAVVPRR
eukprot:766422-Hanusia_phi.AAC.1